ncbi:hypothetical protein QE430_000975 [Microbacterium testaceum]|nr:hypothetical protein [Microbacterium testaceum]
MRTHDDALAIELIEIAADGVDRDAEVRGEVDHRHLSGVGDVGGEFRLPARRQPPLRRGCGSVHGVIFSTVLLRHPQDL